MHADRASSATAFPATRSKITNRADALIGVDGRGSWARRRRDLIRALSQEISDRSLTTRETVLVGNVASMIVRSEQMNAALVRGDDVDPDQLVRLGNVVSRLLTSLGIRASSGKERAPTLAQYLAERAASVAAGSANAAPRPGTAEAAEQHAGRQRDAEGAVS